MLFTYDPSIHDYSTDKPELVCIGHDHWVFGNKKEIEEYKATREKNVPLKTITILDKDAPRPEEHHDNIAHDEIQLPPLHDTGSAWYALLSFLLPVIGIIASLRNTDIIVTTRCAKRVPLQDLLYLQSFLHCSC